MADFSIDKSLQAKELGNILGYNLLGGIIPEIKDSQGERPITKNRKNQEDDSAPLQITGLYDAAEHIDVLADSYTMTYDMGESYSVDFIVTSGYWRGENPMYMLYDYELYLSDDKENLYSEKNLVGKENNAALVAEIGPRQSESIINLVGASGRYFGFKVNKACNQDDISRITYLGVYNNIISKSRCFIPATFESNALTANKIEITTDFEGEPESLVNGKVFQKEDSIIATNPEIKLDISVPCHAVAIVGEYTDFEVFAADGKVKGKLLEYDTDSAEKCQMLLFDASKEGPISIRVEGEAVLEQIVVNSFYREADVDIEDIKTKDFVGIGANDIPCAWMPESVNRGFRPVYWPVYRHHMEKSKPAVVRMWFQIDWIVTEEENYKKGICNFESDKMRDVIKYLDAYEKADIDVELNFGWKVGSLIQDWFSVPAVNYQLGERGNKTINDFGLNRRCSAPKDFDGFAKCCASTIRELCEIRGYTCIKHLTFYNESNYGDTGLSGGDFAGYPGKSKEMWEVMLRAVDKELKAQNLDNYVDYWLAEESGRDNILHEWVDYMMTNCRDLNALNTFHRYKMRYDERLDFFKGMVEHAGEVGAIASEFAVYEEPEWDRSNVEYVMSMLHSGIRGGLYWILQGVMLTDPSLLYLNGDSPWWSAPYEEATAGTENRSYHDFCLFTHYLPRHSKVFNTTIGDYDDIRIEAIETAKGEYSIFVESREAKFPKDIKINFGKNIGKTFRKHVYNPKTVKLDGNLRVPPAEKELQVGDTLCDTLGADYQFVCYTSIPAFPQVNLEETFIKLPVGESKKILAELNDCEGEVIYEIVYGTGVECDINADGVFTQNEGTIAGDKYCIKASLKSNPDVYGVAIVKIV